MNRFTFFVGSRVAGIALKCCQLKWSAARTSGRTSDAERMAAARRDDGQRLGQRGEGAEVGREGRWKEEGGGTGPAAGRRRRRPRCSRSTAASVDIRTRVERNVRVRESKRGGQRVYASPARRSPHMFALAGEPECGGEKDRDGLDLSKI
jgi:hypothetical protein